MEKKVIAVYTISNVGGLAMYEANDEYVAVGYNDEKPRNYKLYYATRRGHYFMINKRRYYLDEFMRV